MRVGDKIMIVHKLLTTNYGVRPIEYNETIELRRARITRFSFDRGKRRIQYRAMAADSIPESGHTKGAEEGLKWCRGWDPETPEACALLVATALR